MQLPSHPEADDSTPDQTPATTARWGTVVVVALLVALLALFVILHLTGVVGPTAH